MERRIIIVILSLVGACATPASPEPDVQSTTEELHNPNDPLRLSSLAMLKEGRRTFRYDTFGDETFWGDTIKLHEAVATLSPKQALGLGLKVDSAALPRALREQLRRGQVDLDSPATTLALLKLNAVVGVTGFFSDDGKLRSIGVQCAICHSVVDDSLAPGVGLRRDGWANRDLDIGQIIAAAPDLSVPAQMLGVDQDTVRKVLRSWGPGKYDAELFLDGKAFRPDGKPAATLIPPAFGMAGINLHTWTGWGSVPHWNGFVGNLALRGHGTFFDPRLDDAARFPVAAANGFGHVTSEDDRVTPKLPALHFYQLALLAPKPPRGSFDAEAAERGDELFEGKAQCARCHVEPIFTEPGWNLHTPAEVGVDDFQSERSPDRRYRTTPLAGLWTHTKGGFFHDGRFATLDDVVEHYDQLFSLGLTEDESRDLVEYLKSL